MTKLFYFTGIFLLVFVFNNCSKEKRFALQNSQPTYIKASSATLDSHFLRKKNKGSVQEKGFCYSTEQNPEYGDNTTTGITTTEGYFTANITGLKHHTTYYERSFAKLKDGTIIYGNQITFETNGEYTQGDIGPAGGVIIYPNASFNGRYCEAILTDNPGLPWGCEGKSIAYALNNNIGYGQVQSQAIADSCSTPGIASRYCLNLTLNGFSDWALPTSGDMQELINCVKEGTVNFPKDKYWTCSESEKTKGFYGDLITNRIWVEKKSVSLKIIVVRNFN